LIQAAARTGKPLIISTGLCEIDDIARALDAARGAGARDIAILKCTSAYPAESKAQNLLTIPDMTARFRIPVGFSDHTLGNAVSIAAVALGAAIVEKHFIDAHDPPTADSAFSCLPRDLAALRRDMDEAWKARGTVMYGATSEENESLGYRRSLYVVAPVAYGQVIQRHHVRSIRPGHGLAPHHLGAVIGRVAARDLTKGEPLRWDMVQGGDGPQSP
jgi:N-acetylneuraminate synthase